MARAKGEGAWKQGSVEARERVLASSHYVHKRNRRKYRRRFSNFHTLAMVILLATITSASISAFERLRDGFLRSSIFTVKEVLVQGNRRISSADILDTSNLRVGIDSIYSIMPHIVEKRIKARFRYLERVEIQRKFVRERGERTYGWVTIAVKEREPVARISFGRDADSFVVIDAHGFILEEGIQERETLRDMPVVVEPVTRHGSQVTGLALDVLTDARSVIPELFDKISHINARDPDNIIVILDTGSGNRDQSPGNRGFSPDPYRLIPDPSPESNIKYPVSSRTTIRIASDRIKEGLSNALLVMKRREKNDGGTRGQGDRGTSSLQTPYVSFDARFPGAVYCKVDEFGFNH